MAEIEINHGDYNHRYISSSTMAYNNEIPERNNTKPIYEVNHQRIATKTKDLVDEMPKPTTTINARPKVYSQVPFKKPVTSNKVKETITLVSLSQPRALPQSSEWMGCLPLIEIPMPINQNINDDNSNNSSGVEIRFQPHQPFFPKGRPNRPPSYRSLCRRRRTSQWTDWQNYLEFVRRTLQ